MVITDDRLMPPAAPELLAHARAGDADSFCVLVEPLQARLLRQAAALTGDLDLAEDIVSETLIEAWKSFPRYNESCQLSTWLYAILLHRYQKSVRRARSRPIALAWLSLFEARDLSNRQENLMTPGPSPAEAAAQNKPSFTYANALSCSPKSTPASFCCDFSKMLPCRTWQRSWAVPWAR